MFSIVNKNNMLMKIGFQKNLFIEMVLNDFIGMYYELMMKG